MSFCEICKGKGAEGLSDSDSFCHIVENWVLNTLWDMGKALGFEIRLLKEFQSWHLQVEYTLVNCLNL